MIILCECFKLHEGSLSETFIQGICRASARPPAFLPTTPRFPSSLEGIGAVRLQADIVPSGYRSLNGANGLG